MRPLELLFSGQAADLPASTKGLVKLTQARTALADPTQRVGEYSFPLTLPATRRNAGIFGVEKLHPQGLGKFGPATDYPYELRVGGQVFVGTFRLTSLKNGYTGSLIGEGLSWALLLAGRKLTDLAFAPVVGYNGSQLAATLAKECDATDVQFPLIAWGNFFSPPLQEYQPDGSLAEVPSPAAPVLDWPLAVDDYPPGVYYVNVLRQIFRSIGWELVGRELDSDFWRQVVLTCAGADVEAAWPWGSLLPASADDAGLSRNAWSYYESDPLGTGSQYSNTAAGWQQDKEIFFLNLATPRVLSSPTRALEASRTSYTAPRNGVYTFAWTATITQLRQTVEQKGSSTPVAAAVGSGFRSVGLGLAVRRQGRSFGTGGLCLPYSGGAFGAGQDDVLTPHVLTSSTPLGLSTSAPGALSGSASVYLEAGDEVCLAFFAQRRYTDDDGNVRLVREEFYTEYRASFTCTAYADDDGVSVTDLQPAAFLPPLSCVELVRDYLLRTDSFLVADAGRRVATVLTRAELAQAGGPALDLSDLVDPRAVEYLPLASGTLSFAPASNSDEPLLPAGTDAVTATIGPGPTAQSISSQFAAVGFRPTWIPQGFYVPLPTCSTKDILAQDRSSAE